MADSTVSWADKVADVRSKGVLGMQLYAVFTEPAGDLQAVHDTMGPHLAYQKELEKKGILFAAGPFADGEARLPLDGLALLPPVPDPPKILCIGRNYAEHAKEGGAEVPAFPDIFMRSRLSLVGDGKPIIRPPVSEKLDFEGELMVAIGKTVHRADRQTALDAIAGYAVFNDATLRDYQRRTTQWTIGKNFDHTGAFGPEFVSADEVPPGATGLQVPRRGSLRSNRP